MRNLASSSCKRELSGGESEDINVVVTHIFNSGMYQHIKDNFTPKNRGYTGISLKSNRVEVYTLILDSRAQFTFMANLCTQEERYIIRSKYSYQV